MIISERKQSIDSYSFASEESGPVKIQRYCMQEHKPVNNESWKLIVNPWMKTKWAIIKEKIQERKKKKLMVTEHQTTNFKNFMTDFFDKRNNQGKSLIDESLQSDEFKQHLLETYTEKFL